MEVGGIAAAAGGDQKMVFFFCNSKSDAVFYLHQHLLQ